MPIKKRTSLPPKPKVQIWSTSMTAPGRSLEELVKEHDRLAEDYAWNGDQEAADFHQGIANRFRERLEAGELYEVDF